jgi:hypothetical protein
MRFQHFVAEHQRLMLIAIVGITVSSASALVGYPSKGHAAQAFSWANAIEAYDKYIDYPIPENAKSLLAALPMDISYGQIGNAGRERKHIFSADNFPVLHFEALSGDSLAVEILFRLLNVTDAAYAETVEATLGTVLRFHPKVFLDVCLIYENAKVIKTWGFPATFTGQGYFEHPKAARVILEKRIEALEGVTDSKYAIIKDACIRAPVDSIKRRWGS